MTYGDFRTRVIQECERMGGQTLINLADTARLDARIDESLKDFARDTMVLPVDHVPLTLVPQTSEYWFADPAGAKLVAVTGVVIEGELLDNMVGKKGPISVLDLDRFERFWRTVPSGRPKYWWPTGGDRVRLWPTPDAAYSDCGLAGFRWPVKPAQDTGALDLPLEARESAIYWAAFRVMAQGQGFSEPKVLELGEMARQGMNELARQRNSERVLRQRQGDLSRWMHY